MLAGVQGVAGDERFITVASTTSTENSGLFRHILPLFKARTGIAVRVVAVGTGQAIRLARNGDADVLLVHHRPSEIAFVAAGHGVARRDVMYNDFVLVGPKADPAGLRGVTDAAAAFARLAAARALFASRGDDSGTHKTELGLWRAAGVEVAAASGSRYREMGAGMGATLNSAAAMDAYALADRATWLAFSQQGRARDPGRGRSAAVQSIRRHPGEPGPPPSRETGRRPNLHRLAHRRRGAAGDRRIQARRPATFRSERRQELNWVNAAPVAAGHRLGARCRRRASQKLARNVKIVPE